jgi:hypothetical protein
MNHVNYVLKYFQIMEIVKDAAVAGFVGTITSGSATVVAQTVTSAAIPSLMSAGATVISGVGSIMPVWIAPLQVFAVGSLSTVAAPVAVVGGVITATGYVAYYALN